MVVSDAAVPCEIVDIIYGSKIFHNENYEFVSESTLHTIVEEK